MNRVETKEQVFLCDKFKQKVQFRRAVMLLLRFSPRDQDTFGSPAAITAAFFMFRSFLSFFLFLSFTYIAWWIYNIWDKGRGGLRGAVVYLPDVMLGLSRRSEV